jgi:hypothetical protein
MNNMPCEFKRVPYEIDDIFETYQPRSMAMFNPNSVGTRTPLTVMQAIYNCRVCNLTAATMNRCRCDMGPIHRKYVPLAIPYPLAAIPEVDESDKTLEPLLKVAEADLPGDLVGRYAAINKIFRDSEKK